MNKKLALASLALMLTMTGCGGNQSQIDSLQKENQTLKDEKCILQDETQTLQEEKQSLVEMNQNLVKENQALQKEIQTMKANLQKGKSNEEAAKKEKAKLKSQVNELSQKKVKLEKRVSETEAKLKKKNSEQKPAQAVPAKQADHTKQADHAKQADQTKAASVAPHTAAVSPGPSGEMPIKDVVRYINRFMGQTVTIQGKVSNGNGGNEFGVTDGDTSIVIMCPASKHEIINGDVVIVSGVVSKNEAGMPSIEPTSVQRCK